MTGHISQAPGQQEDFRARLERMGHVAEARPMMPAEAPRPRPKPKGPVKLYDWRENIGYPLSFVGAFLIGAFSVAFAKYVLFHTSGAGTPADAPVDPLAAGESMILLDLGMALAISFFLKLAFRLEAKEWAIAQTVGIVVMSAVFHNFVHLWPETFAAVFSAEWVAMEMLMNDLGTVSFMGYTFVFEGASAAS